MTSLFGLGHDLRVACRRLMNQPAFSLMIVGILTIGVAAMTAVFSLFNGVFLRPFPVPTERRLTYLCETDRKTAAQDVGVAYPRFHAWQQYNQTFECMGFYSVWTVTVSLGDKAQRIGIRLATYDYLRVLGLRPVLGRYFTAEEDRPGGPNVALVSFGLWERLFARDPAVLGRTVQLDGEPFTIIGVLPPEADFPERKFDVWQPLRADAQGHHGGMGTVVMGLLKPGVTLEQAREDLTRIHQGWAQQNPEQELTTQPAVLPFREVYRGQVKQYQLGLSVLQGVVGFAMLTACCNVASIMLARGAFQTREFALRAALGASRGRIIGHVLIESLVLFVVGGSLGVVVGQQALALLLSRLTSVVPAWMRFPLDVHCVLFCVAVVGGGTLLSGLLPALHAALARDVHAVLQSAGTRTTVSRGRRRTLNVIVTAEIALALALLVSAGLLLRTFHQVQSIDPGFRKAGVLTYNIHFPVGPYLDEGKRRAFWDQHLERIRTLPGVTQAALSDYVPGAFASFDELDIEGLAPTDAGPSRPAVLRQKVTPGYFETLGVKLLAGRFFVDQDNRKDSEPVAIINETFAKRFWPDASSLDQRIRRSKSAAWLRVVGVTGDVIQARPDQPPWPTIYLPSGADVPFGMFGIVRASGDPLSLMASVREAVRAADSGVPIQDIGTMAQRLDDALWVRRLSAWLFGIPAAAAALMAFGGIYGVMSYSVSRRVQEIGIRMTLGASRREVIRMVTRQAFRLIVVGLLFGVAGGFILSRLLASLPGMLYQVSPNDPVTFLGVIFLLTAVALLACYLPARRAARVDPMIALRHE
jgi:putative ABC transport system permease protein